MWQALEIETWIAGRRSEIDRVRGPVSEIIARVRSEGDAALIDLTKRFDGIDLDEIAVSDEEREAAYDQVDAQLIESLAEAEARISRFHELQRGRDLWLQEMEPGITLGVRTTPLFRIGAYVPGGRAAYPSCRGDSTPRPRCGFFLAAAFWAGVQRGFLPSARISFK